MEFTDGGWRALMGIGMRGEEKRRRVRWMEVVL